MNFLGQRQNDKIKYFKYKIIIVVLWQQNKENKPGCTH